MRVVSFLAIVMSAAMLAPTHVIADGYPSKTITLICPYSAGGGGDTASRMIAKLAGDMMGVQINVENKTGGGATIGIGAVAKGEARRLHGGLHLNEPHHHPPAHDASAL